MTYGYSPLICAAKDGPSPQHFSQSSTEYTISWALTAQAPIIGEWAAIRSRYLNGSTACPHVTLISRPTFNPLCTQKFSMVDGGPQNSQNWMVGPYLEKYSRYKHVMFTRTGQMENFSFFCS